MAFHVDNAFLDTKRDLLVLTGKPEGTPPRAGGGIDLPREVNGPGWVPILAVQTVPFADGTRKPCVILDYAVMDGAPMMEFSALEGLTLDTRAA